MTAAELTEFAKAMRSAGVARFEDGALKIELHPSAFVAHVLVEEPPAPQELEAPRGLPDWDKMTPEQQLFYSSSPDDSEVSEVEKGLGTSG